MFAVLFEARPHADRSDAYFDLAGRLRPELERIEGFVENRRFRSLTRAGWLLSLSLWRDERALVRWRSHASHHAVQARGRAEVLADYHLRVGPLTHDSAAPEVARSGDARRGDVTGVGRGGVLSLHEGAEAAGGRDAPACASALGLDVSSARLAGWDVFEPVATPGGLLALATWRDEADAEAGAMPAATAGLRLRRVRVLRDYGLSDRREAPQWHAPAPAPR